MSNIIGNKGSSSEHVHYEAPDSLHSTSFARVLDLVSEGEILGLSEGLQSVYLNDTPVQNADGSSNFQNVAIDFRPGTQTQDFIAGFPDVENEVAVGVELKASAPWVHAVGNTALSAIRITLGVPALSQSDTSNGDIKGYKIDYKIELSTDGGAYATVLTSSFNGKTTTAYQRTARIDLPAASTGWQVRVTRLTANANVATTSDTTTVISYTEVIDAKLRYPMSAIVGVQVDAKQFQSVPTRAYDLMGRIIQVPSNYDPRTRTYSSEIWDGTFKPSWTDNPAWIFRDLALNDRYGLGHRLTTAQLDKWSLYAIARYCDELVPDGKGGSEPRFSCNVYLQAQKQAYAVLQDLASIFRGISYWGAGSIVASADMPADPVYVYTAANVIGGKFSRVGSSKKTRYTTALVSWNDPADMYKAKVEYVEDAEGITRYGIQPVSLTAFGCTSQGQAQRVGRWALATSRLETEMISFDVGMDGAIALPGQIVRVSDPARMGRRNGGRIKTASGRVVVLDKAPTISAGDKLTAILPSGKSETHTVVSIAGDAVTVDADWTALPVAQSVWSVDSTVLIAPTYKVVSVTEKDGNTFTISATQHEPGKFGFIENGIAIAPRPESALNSAVQQPPASVTVSAYTVSLQDVQKLGFTASCPVVPGATAYECSFQVDSSNWFNLPRQAGPEFDVLDVLAGNYTVRIVAVNSLGIMSIPTVSAATLVSKNANPRNADILLQLSAPGFNVNADGTITPASITVHATLLDLDGTPSFSAVGGSITSSGNNATLYAADMPGAASTVTATITALGQTFTKSIDIVKSADGAAGADKFMWVKYGTSATGDGLTDNPAGMSYMGIAVNKSSPIESTVASDYTWAQIKGANGADGASTFTGTIYKQQVGQPATPTGGSYNFATGTLTPPAGWSATRPTSSTTPTWGAPYQFTAATIGATVTAGTWGTPVIASLNGNDGVAGPQNFVVSLFKYGTAAPTPPTGFSTLNWVTLKNDSYSGSDGWAVVPPANPGTPGLQLYIASQGVSAAAGVTSTPNISYSSASIAAYVANGPAGAPGVQSREIKVFQWAATIPAAPAGNGALSWATGLFGGAPANWSLTPGAAVPGYTQWSAKVLVNDAAGATSTPFAWSTASIGAETYSGGDGLSYGTAYVATTVGTASTAPAPTTGKDSLPPADSSGLPGTPQATVPTLAPGQYLMQFDAIYNPATNQKTWSIPYQSSAKFGSLSSASDNTGTLTVSGTVSSANGKFKVDEKGAVTMSAATILAADGVTPLFQSGIGLTQAGAAPGTLNADIAPVVNNLIPSNTLPTSIAGFTAGATQTVTGGWDGPSMADPIYSPHNLGAIQTHAAGTPPVGSVVDLYWNQGAARFPVIPKQRYEFSAAVAAHRCTGYVVAAFYKADGTYITEFPGNQCASGGDYGNTPGDLFPRSLIFAVAPDTASTVMILTRQLHNGTQSEPYVFTSEMYMGVASATQTVGSKYTNLSSVQLANAASAAQATAVAAIDSNFISRGNVTLLGNTGTKTSGQSAWDSDVYSKNGYIGGAIAQATVPNVNAYGIMFGLNTDPTTDGSYFSLDYAIYITGSGIVQCYESGTLIGGTNTAVANGDVLAVTYDGSTVRYLRNGAPFRTVAVTITAPLFFDSSFATPGAVLTNMSFTGQSSNNWADIRGTGKAADNATVGATFGPNGNINGQMTVAQVPSYIPANSITNTLIGGNLLSSNWAGATSGPTAVGWLLERDTGNLYANSVRLRGAVMGGDYVDWGWPASGKVGFYAGPEGFKAGNYNDQKYFQASANGSVYMNGFVYENGQLTLTNTVLIAPRIGDNMQASISPGTFGLQRAANQQFTDVYAGNFTASMSNTSGTVTYSWSISTSSSQVTGAISSPTASSVSASVTGKLQSGQEIDLTISCTVSNNGISKSASATITVTVP